LGRRQERCLLGLLLLEAGRMVPAERLIDLLWRDAPPASARPTLYTYVSRLRARLSPLGVHIASRGCGYAIEIDPYIVDVHRFVAEVDCARTIDRPAERASALTSALQLWRGPLLADVADDDLRQRLGAGLEERRLAAIEWQIEAHLAAGDCRQALAMLTEQVQRHPTQEHLVELFMLALYQVGRQADALATYRRVRRTLRDDLGVDPSPRLQRMNQRILTHAADLTS